MQDPRIEALVAFARSAPDGVTVDAIEEHLTPRVPRRTIQSWLAQLVDERRLRSRGSARATRYFARDAAPQNVTPEPPPKVTTSPAQPVPVVRKEPVPAPAKSAPVVVPSAGAPVITTAPPIPPPVAAAPVPDRATQEFFKESITRALWACVKAQEAPQFFRAFAQHRLQVSDAEAEKLAAMAIETMRKLDAPAAAKYGVPGYAFEMWQKRSGVQQAATASAT